MHLDPSSPLYSFLRYREIHRALRSLAFTVVQHFLRRFDANSHAIVNRIVYLRDLSRLVS